MLGLSWPSGSNEGATDVHRVRLLVAMVGSKGIPTNGKEQMTDENADDLRKKFTIQGRVFFLNLNVDNIK